jgi:hypothetical protein
MNLLHCKRPLAGAAVAVANAHNPALLNRNVTRVDAKDAIHC